MSGRHVVPTPTRRRSSWLVPAASAALVGSVASAVLLAGSGHDGAGSRADAATSCAHRVDLSVTASPAIAPATERIAAAWAASLPAPQRRCLSISVRGVDDATAEAAIAAGSSAPALWVPDSSIWSQRLAADLDRSGTGGAVTVAGSVASSPLVVVDRAGAPAAVDPAALVRAAAQGAPVLTPNPLTTAEGLLAVDALRSAAPQPMRDQVGLMVALGRATLDATGTGFAQLASPGARPFWASEQAVVAARAVAAARYPSRGVAALDFPAVVVTRPDGDPDLSTTARGLARAMQAVTAQRILASYGFRDPQGDPIPGATGPGSAPVAAATRPTAQSTADVLRMWSAATEASHTLAVIDVSGSMAGPAGNGRSKIDVAAAAAAAATAYFPDSSAFGLWAFSSDQADGLPWAELSALTDLGARTGTLTQRQRLVAATGRLPGLVGGHTALYDTTLAAFEQVRNTYDPSRVNSVVLLTDGMNDYPQGLGLTDLLNRLRSLVDPARPVPVITIGIGDQADLATLRRISAVTGGKTYVVRNPAGIRDVFLDAMLQRECRPSCPAGS